MNRSGLALLVGALVLSTTAARADDAGDAGDSGKPVTTPTQDPKYVDASDDAGESSSSSSSSNNGDSGCMIAPGESGLGTSIVLLAGLMISTRRRRPRR